MSSCGWHRCTKDKFGPPHELFGLAAWFEDCAWALNKSALWAGQLNLDFYTHTKMWQLVSVTVKIVDTMVKPITDSLPV